MILDIIDDPNPISSTTTPNSTSTSTTSTPTLTSDSSSSTPDTQKEDSTDGGIKFPIVGLLTGFIMILSFVNKSKKSYR